VDNRFDETARHGKYLFAGLHENGWLMLHFGMTGQLEYFQESENEPDYARLMLDFENGHYLAFVNMRKLGSLALTESPGSFAARKKLGPDVLDAEFDFAAFRELLSGRRAMSKSALMNQQLMAGIGTIYADEILFQARVDPRRKVNQLAADELRSIYDSIREVLETAVEHRAERSEFPDSYLLAHREEGAPCPDCNGRIEKIEVVGRPTYFCPNCQT
jgi:formamidopyrimidine-DNA glycosylase